MKEERNINYDIIRIIACAMIIMMHSPISNENANGFFLSSLSYLSAPGIGLFFMISGALLLPIHSDTKSFFKKRFTKILFPALFWSLFYLCVKTIFIGKSIDIKAILSLLFSAQGNPVLWFVYTLVGLYLLAPILSKWLQGSSIRELEFYLGLWTITLCYPLLKYIVVINSSDTGILYYFSGYAGYFILGFYLKSYPNRTSWQLLISLLIISMAVPVICKLEQVKVDFYDLFWYLSIFVVVQCVCWWKLICGSSQINIGPKTSRFITELSKMTFGIYLVHIFIMRNILWHNNFILSINNYYLQTAVIIILTFILSAICTYLISLLPKAQYIIGYKSSLK